MPAFLHLPDMPLFISSLNSGSNANCYYIGNEEEAILVDAGLSCRETERRMKRLGLSINKVKAVFISHEHTDHISGLQGLAKKYHCLFYFSPKTYGVINASLEEEWVRYFESEEEVTVGRLNVTPFKKNHDACDPHSFTITCEQVTVGVFTDIGSACDKVRHYFSRCHAAFLESNYSEQLLEEGSYPAHLKKRISGGKGHLSNSEALQLFKENRSASLSHLILSHLSQNNNRPQIVEELFAACANGIQIVVAPRVEETPLFCIQGVPGPVKSRVTDKPHSCIQLSLF